MGNDSARLLIAEASSIRLLAAEGVEALDWLFLPGFEVWMTDLVHAEACRKPGGSDDQGDSLSRTISRTIREWMRRNENRINIQQTDAGNEHRKALLNWEACGKPSELEPTQRSDDAVFLDALKAIKAMVESSRSVVAIVDHRTLNEVVANIARVPVVIRTTRQFIRCIAEKYSIRRESIP